MAGGGFTQPLPGADGLGKVWRAGSGPLAGRHARVRQGPAHAVVASSSHVAPRAFNEANLARSARTHCDVDYKLREVLRANGRARLPDTDAKAAQV